MRSRPPSARGRYRGPIHQPAPQPGRQGAGFQSFYPIVTPPGFGAVYPQTQQPQSAHHGPLNANNGAAPANQNRPADYYRPPQYWLQRVNAPSESIGSQRPKPSVNKANADSDPQGGSVARMVELGDVADDLANIHFDHIQAEVGNNPPILLHPVTQPTSPAKGISLSLAWTTNESPYMVYYTVSSRAPP
ncbi:hypothetical protein PGT21_009118 [Puccinia graminis f. sp. tritici]|uniref:Uncharacterized protein n=1 Tax=Puccinia graminis f. sp. tritici TaxID=56615 RepID=A0A5B0LL14_PUCGR|nr:hypothetical protein PGT21_009118 [Puccinia graminis f. sp. tritici]